MVKVDSKTLQHQYQTDFFGGNFPAFSTSMAYWLGCWIPNLGVQGSEPLGCFKVDSAFHPFKVDQISAPDS